MPRRCLMASAFVETDMHTLEQLRRGDLAGVTRLDLSCDLEEVPDDLLALADSLEVLNLTGNRLATLPNWLPKLHKLKVLFCSDNAFTRLPSVLGECRALEMVGFKANRIAEIPGDALPAALRWFILTDNAVTALPETLGACRRLQKLMLAGNQLSTLPASLAECDQLELIRIAANRFERLPDWITSLPRLAWLALGGNPCEATPPLVDAAPVSRATLEFGETLGEGASGVIRSVLWRRHDLPPQPMAVKLFKGDVTSDGTPASEMAACLAAGLHPNLLPVTAPLANEPGATPGLLMPLLDARFAPLAGPPSLASCTRDCYAPERRFSPDQLLAIVRGVASAVGHLHRRGILHGDLYAHNLLVDPAGGVVLSDFGAASFHRPGSELAFSLQRLESLAFGRLLGELLERTEPLESVPLARLRHLQATCEQPSVSDRPDFAQINLLLDAL